MSLRLTSLAIAATTLFSSLVHAFNQNARTNLAVYWGQNSYGATHGSDQANWQQNIDYYCQDDTIDAIPIAFLTVAFSTGNLPSIDVSNICSVNSNSVFPGTNLPDCSALASKIQTCQSKGKIVTLSIGGATGGVSPTSTAQAVQLADNVWNLFLGGSSSTRPFSSAVLDGVDLDIEGGTSAFWGDFVKEIRAKSNGASKKYYVTGAPQCVFPDAYLGTALNQVAFDAVYVQFYNNWCGVQNFNNPNAWNFGAWDSWAKSSPNPNVKVYIGVPGAPTAAGSGYVDAGTLTNIIKTTAAQYSSFGGVMMWDASQAYANGRFDKAIKSALLANVGGGGSQPGTTTAKPPATTTKVTTPPPTTTSKPPSGSCGSVPGWVANVAYVAGDQVLYNGALWTATQWNYASAPGGAAGAWTRVGACASAQASRLKPSLDLNYTPTVPTPTVSPAAARRDVFRFKRD